jgi:DNA-binding transcriptional ArsR family regulator
LQGTLLNNWSDYLLLGRLRDGCLVCGTIVINANFIEMKITDLSTGQLEMAANMLKAIAHPMRIAILSLLENGNKMTVTEIHQQLQIEQSTTSHHLGILKDKGVLASERDGKNTFYYLKHNSLSQIVECVGNCTHYAC